MFDSLCLCRTGGFGLFQDTPDGDIQEHPQAPFWVGTRTRFNETSWTYWLNLQGPLEFCTGRWTLEITLPYQLVDLDILMDLGHLSVTAHDRRDRRHHVPRCRDPTISEDLCKGRNLTRMISMVVLFGDQSWRCGWCGRVCCCLKVTSNNDKHNGQQYYKNMSHYLRYSDHIL